MLCSKLVLEALKQNVFNYTLLWCIYVQFSSYSRPRLIVNTRLLFLDYKVNGWPLQTSDLYDLNFVSVLCVKYCENV